MDNMVEHMLNYNFRIEKMLSEFSDLEIDYINTLMFSKEKESVNMSFEEFTARSKKLGHLKKHRTSDLRKLIVEECIHFDQETFYSAMKYNDHDEDWVRFKKALTHLSKELFLQGKDFEPSMIQKMIETEDESKIHRLYALTLAFFMDVQLIYQGQEDLSSSYYLAMDHLEKKVFTLYLDLLAFEQKETMDKLEQQKLRNTSLYEQLDHVKENYSKSQKEKNTLKKEKESIEKQLKETQKKINNDSTTKKVNTDLQNKERELKGLQETIRLKETEIQSLIEQNLSLKKQNTMLFDQINEWKKIEHSNETTDIDVFDYLDQVITQQQIDEDLYEFALRIIDVYESNAEEINIASNPLNPNQIGYVVWLEDAIYVQIPKKSLQPIRNISEDTYLIEHQFIMIDSFGNLKKVFNEMYIPSKQDAWIDAFCMISSVKKNIIADLGNQEQIDLSSTIPFSPKKNQIIALNNQDEYITHYKKISMKLESLIPHIHYKGHRISQIREVLTDGFILRDLFTNEDSFYMYRTPSDFYISEILVHNEQQILRYFDYRFYVQSSYFTHSYIGTVLKSSNPYLLKKQDRTLQVIKNIPNNIQLVEGDVVSIDDFGHFIELKSTQQEEIKVTLGKKKVKVNLIEKHVLPAIYLKVLIVGNITYEHNYKTSLRKHGIEATVICGHSPYFKIEKSIVNQDYIVHVDEAISHDNSWKLKSDYPDRLIFSRYSGANKILLDLQMQEEKKKEWIRT